MLQTERPKIRTKHSVTYMTPEEINSVFARIEKEGRPMTKNRDACIVALGLGTGLRVSAIVNINVEDIDFKTSTIKVIEKGRKTREIKFSNHLRKALLVWYKDRELFFGGEETGPLFISQKKNRMSVDSVQAVVKKYTDHLSKHITPHKLRYTAANQALNAGATLYDIQNFLGHSSPTVTTQCYLQESESSVKKTSKLLSENMGL